jgi:hypothetical protein
MLFGGALMLVALVLLLGFLGRTIKRVASVVGGIGFGLFIDEVGKFITSDNDYFYRPTIAIIYAVFVVIFMWLRALGRRQSANEETYLANSLMLFQDAALHDLDPREKYQLLIWLRQTGSAGKELLGDAAQAVLSRPPDVIAPSPILRKLWPVSRRLTAGLRSRWAARIAIGILLLRTAGAIVTSLGLLFAGGATGPGESVDLPLLISAGISGFLTLVGLAYLMSSRLRALRWFRRSILASILLTDLFTFYYQQLWAVADLAADLVVLAIIDSALETELRRVHPPARAQAASFQS